MADKSKTVEIIFGGVDRTGSAIGSVGRNLGALEDKIGAVTGPMANVADSILKLEGALVAMGAAALAFATKEAITFEAALVDLEKVMGEGEGSANDYADTFSDLSSRFGVDASAVIQSAADFRQAGFDIGDSLTLVEQSLLAVNAADLTTQQSSELMIGTLAGFQAPASEAARLLDVLNGVSNNAGASVEQLGEGFKVISPLAKTLGLSFEETAALLTPMVEVTRSGSESANALRTAISNLIKPTAERKALLEDELGIQLEINGERRDTKDVLYDLIDATQSLDNNERQRVATIIAGSEQMSRFLAVLNNAERSEEILKVAMNSAGSAVEEFNTKASSAEFAMKQLQAAFQTAAATAGTEYLDQTKAVTQATTSLVDAFRDAIQGDNAEVLFSALRNGLDELAERIDIIAKNLPEAFEGVDFTGLLGAFGDLGGELQDTFTAVFGEIDLTTVEGLQEALQKIADGFTALTNVTSGIINGLEPLFSAIGAGIEEFQNLDSATQKSVGELLGLAKTIDTVLPLLGGLGSGLESVGNGLMTLAGAQGFKALIGNLNSVKTLAAGAGRFGLVGLALAGGYGIGTLINDHIIAPIEDAFGTSIGSWLYEKLNQDELIRMQGEAAKMTGEYARLAQETGELKALNDTLADSLDNTKQAAELDIDALNRRAAELVNNANKQTGLNNSLEEFSGSQRATANAVEALTDQVARSGGTLSEVSDTTAELADKNKTLQLGYDETTGKVNSFSGGVIRSGEAMDDAAEKTRNVIEESEEYRLKLLEIASDERIANIEAKVSLDIAEVEANADKVAALAKSISDTFASTGELIGSLFGTLNDAEGLDAIAVARQIEKENERREQALKLQEKLTNAEIKYIEAKTKSLRNGDSMIKVDGAGLQPHLEAFMFEILRTIQVRVNADGEEMLVGLGAG